MEPLLLLWLFMLKLSVRGQVVYPGAAAPAPTPTMGPELSLPPVYSTPITASPAVAPSPTPGAEEISYPTPIIVTPMPIPSPAGIFYPITPAPTAIPSPPEVIVYPTPITASPAPTPVSPTTAPVPLSATPSPIPGAEVYPTPVTATPVPPTPTPSPTSAAPLPAVITPTTPAPFSPSPTPSATPGAEVYPTPVTASPVLPTPTPSPTPGVEVYPTPTTPAPFSPSPTPSATPGAEVYPTPVTVSPVLPTPTPSPTPGAEVFPTPTTPAPFSPSPTPSATPGAEVYPTPVTASPVPPSPTPSPTPGAEVYPTPITASPTPATPVSPTPTSVPGVTIYPTPITVSPTPATPVSPVPAPTAETITPTSEGSTLGLLTSPCGPLKPTRDLTRKDADLLNSLLKMEYLLAQFYLWAAFDGDSRTFSLDMSPSRFATNKTRFLDDHVVHHMLIEFTAHQLGHISAIAQFLRARAVNRPAMNIGKDVFSDVMNAAFGDELTPSFDPLANTTNLLLASYIMSPLAPALAVGILPELEDKAARMLVAGMLGALASEDAAIRTMLFSRKDQIVQPYSLTVGVFSQKIVELRNLLDLLDGVNCPGEEDKGFKSSKGKQLGNMMLVDTAGLVPRRSPSGVLTMLAELGVLQGE